MLPYINKMIPAIKQPAVKLIPSDPMTNTILIIYCVSSTGASVPYKAIWRRIYPKKNKYEEIKSHNGSSYRCSPLDLDCVIEATVVFPFQNMQVQKVVQSNLVKVSRELKERRNFTKEPVPCKIIIDEMHIETKVIIQDSYLFVIPANPNFSQNSYAINCMDIVLEADANQHLFRMFFKTKFDDFLNYFSILLGWKPQIKSQYFTFSFSSDINRDMILLGYSQIFQRPTDLLSSVPAQKPQPPQFISELQKSGHAKNRSQTSLSPANKQKIKINEKMQMKKSQTNLKKNEVVVNNITSPSAKAFPKDQAKEGKDEPREYLNVFQEDDMEFLNSPIVKAPEISVKNIQNSFSKNNTHPTPGKEASASDQQPSINLRGSFEELQRSFSNNNQEAIQKAFGNLDGGSKKMQDQIDRLRRQNQQLRKQADLVPTLTKQNMAIKKKYHELKEQINRLQMQRKVILTDKLRCQVNWHKQAQQKQYMKKQLDHFKELLKGNAPYNNEYQFAQRTAKSNSIHEVSATDRQKDRNRSPNSSFYNK